MMSKLEPAIVPKDHNAPPANGPPLEFMTTDDGCARLPRPDSAVPQSCFAYYVDGYRHNASGRLLLRLPSDETAPLVSEMDDERERWNVLLRQHSPVIGLMVVDPADVWCDPKGAQRFGVLQLKAKNPDTHTLLIMAPAAQRDAWRAALVERTDATVSDLYEITPTGLVKFGAEDLHK